MGRPLPGLQGAGLTLSAAPRSPVTVLGIRHHGPGSARSVATALDALAPDCVVIEGPPELDALVPLAAHPDLVPPVAGLVYAVDSPRLAAFYPFAVFSPEWVALQWAVGHDVEVRFADLPATHMLAQGEGKGEGVGRGEGADDVAAGLVGAIVKDPVQDRIVWEEYLETVVKDRREWADLYRACRELG